MGLRILVVEDSLVFRKIITNFLVDTGHVAEVRTAGSGAEGLALARSWRPDVTLADLYLPDLPGQEFLDRLRQTHPAGRIVALSGLGEDRTGPRIQVLPAACQQFLRRPVGPGFQQNVQQLKGELGTVVDILSRRLHPGRSPASDRAPSAGKEPGPRTAGAGKPAGPRGGVWVTAVAVSTGGVQALNQIIPRLPADYPVPVVIVQHMPPVFTGSLARSLDVRSSVTVVEATAGMVLQPGTVYLAPGGKHLTVRPVDGRAITSLNEDPPENSVRPAADVLFRSLAGFPGGSKVLAVILTGMGEDGLAGVRELKRTGCYCLTQSQASCVVYGMPRAVELAGLGDEQVDLADLAARMTRLAVPTGQPVPSL